MSPGLVDTEGVQDHVSKARALQLPHVAFFDKAFESNWTTDMQELMKFVDKLMSLDDATFISKEWRFSEWRQEVAKAQKASAGEGRALAPAAIGAALATAVGVMIGYRVLRSRL